MSNNSGQLQKVLIVSLGLLLMAAIFIAGLTVAAFGFIFLPFLLWKSGKITKSENRPQFKGKAIDAEFKRVEKTDKE